MAHDTEAHDQHDDPRLEEVGDEGVMPGELVDSPNNMPGAQPEDDRPPSPTTPGYRHPAGDRDGEEIEGHSTAGRLTAAGSG